MKLKDLNLENFKYSLVNKNFNGTLINLFYQDKLFEFQTPKVIFQETIKRSDKEYLRLKLQGTNASKMFYDKLISIEKYHNVNIRKNFNAVFDINNVFEDLYFDVKVPYKNSRPLVHIYQDNREVIYETLKPGQEIICLIESVNIWINSHLVPNYHLVVKEIKIV
jgi:hypothetical protein